MLSYRHAFHAGNHADVFKHACLLLLLDALKKKDKPFLYLDTHGGAGLYNLQDQLTGKNREHESGIMRLLAAERLPDPLAGYLDIIRNLNKTRGHTGKNLRWFAGSPLLAAQMLRAQDRALIFEAHPQDARTLAQSLRGHKNVRIIHGDAYATLASKLPPRERRALILIDPAYEQRSELGKTSHLLAQIHDKFAGAVVALWYPLTTRLNIKPLLRAVQNGGIYKRVLQAELQLLPADSPVGLNGSGMLIFNTPYLLEHPLAGLLPVLARILASAGHIPQARWQWLAAEKSNTGPQ